LGLLDERRLRNEVDRQPAGVRLDGGEGIDGCPVLPSGTERRSNDRSVSFPSAPKAVGPSSSSHVDSSIVPSGGRTK
jgi:hypothetical protein